MEALVDYDQTLKKYSSEQLLPLLHEIQFSEGGFVSGTSVYCTKVKGLVYLLEISALTEPSELAKAVTIVKKPRPMQQSNGTKKALNIFKSNGLIFELIECRRSSGTINCRFTLTHSKEEVIYFKLNVERSYSFDEHGSQYKPNIGIFGGRKSRQYPGSDLLPNIPENGNLIFKNIREESKYWDTLAIILTNGTKAVFRNVPLSK